MVRLLLVEPVSSTEAVKGFTALSKEWRVSRLCSSQQLFPGTLWTNWISKQCVDNLSHAKQYT